MKVIYYSTPHHLDHVLLRVRSMSKLVNIRLLLEVAPESWNSSLFDISPQPLASGIRPATDILSQYFPDTVATYWENLDGFDLVIHTCKKATMPPTWRVAWKTINYIKSLHPDIVHFDALTLRLAPFVRRLGNIPVVLNIHDPEPHTGEANWRKDLSRKLSFPHTKCFILHNHAWKDFFCMTYKIPSDKVHVSPLGVYNIYRNWMKSSVLEEPATVLFFGRISPYKGLETLFRAMPYIAKEIPDVKFIIAGRPIPGYTLPAVPNLPGNAKVEMIASYISNTDLAELFQKATVLVLPYTDATQSGVILTSYAFDKPVVASDVGGLSEVVIHNKTGLLVPPRNYEKLADSVLHILKNQKIRQEMKQHIKSLCNNELSWDHIAKQIVAIYEPMVL